MSRPAPRPLAVVTGASGGIGEAFARILAGEQHDLLLVARSGAKLKALAQDLRARFGVAVLAVSADLRATKGADTVSSALKKLGRAPDVLINNAGYGAGGPFARGDEEAQMGMLRLNIEALTRLTHRLLPGMLRRGSGRILNVASTAAFQPGPGMAVYCASKAYVLSFSEAIAHELRGSGVTVTALCPGATRTGFEKAAGMAKTSLFKGKIPGPEAVAACGWRAAKRGRPVVVHGLRNRVMAAAAAFTPRRLLLSIAARMMRAEGFRP
ncbi:MAG: SDR family oxidoreductase [Spirochaetes bacterium]|nr:SDR family oxidoreductase [Spirochaetota bacterium]